MPFPKDNVHFTVLDNFSNKDHRMKIPPNAEGPVYTLVSEGFGIKRIGLISGDGFVTFPKGITYGPQNEWPRTKMAGNLHCHFWSMYTPLNHLQVFMVPYMANQQYHWVIIPFAWYQLPPVWLPEPEVFPADYPTTAGEIASLLTDGNS